MRNEINTLDLQKQGNVVRLEKLNAEKVQLEEERARLEQRIQEFDANAEAEKLKLAPAVLYQGSEAAAVALASAYPELALIVLTRMKRVREYPRIEERPGADGQGAPGHEEQPAADRRG